MAEQLDFDLDYLEIELSCLEIERLEAGFLRQILRHLLETVFSALEAEFVDHLEAEGSLVLWLCSACRKLCLLQIQVLLILSWRHLEVAFLAGLWPHFEAELEAALAHHCEAAF